MIGMICVTTPMMMPKMITIEIIARIQSGICFPLILILFIEFIIGLETRAMTAARMM